jgi:hypothetical protein
VVTLSNGATAAVVIPYTSQCPYRGAALAWVVWQWQKLGLEIVIGRHDGPWSKGAAIADALARTDADLLVISDADVWCHGTMRALDAVKAGECEWAVPHRRVVRLTEGETTAVYGGGELHERTGRENTGVIGGGIVVVPRELYAQAPIDPRFVNWGGEDISFGFALAAVAGPPERGIAPLFHLWHPPAPYSQHAMCAPENDALFGQYVRARGDADAIRSLVSEGVPC